MTETRALTSVERIGFSSRLVRVFHAPRSTFESVADGGSFPDWAAPVALVVLFWAAHNLAVMPIVFPETTPELDQMATQARDVWRSHGWFSLPLVSSFSNLAIVSLVLLGVSRWVLRAEITLRQTLAVKASASLVAIPQWILLTLTAGTGLTTASPLIFTPGVLLADPSATLPGRILLSLNVFDLWQAVVIGIGLSVLTGQASKRTVSIIISLWVAWAVFGALAPASAPPPLPTP